MYAYYRNRPQKRYGFGRILLGSLCVGLLILILRRTVGAREAIISPIPDNSHSASSSSFALKFFNKEKNPEELRAKIQDKVGVSWINYSILVVDYSSGFSLPMNETVIFTAASINKIPIIASLYHLSEKGDIDLDKTITVQEEDIQDYGTGSIRYGKPGATYSVKTLAKLMMQQSDNTAAYILANHIIGVEKIQSLVNSWGLSQTDIEKNKTSNKDMSLLMEKIYHGKITSPAQTQEMLAFFKNSDFEDRLPALLPKTASVYHKIGTGTGVVHDVGVVVDGKSSYYIGIFTSDITDEEQSSVLASEISKLVYDYLKN